MKASGVPPNMVIQMLAINEEDKALNILLGNTATYHEIMVDYIVDSLSSLIGPIIMWLLGGAVGELIIAVYFPICNMNDAVSGKQTSELGQDIS
jgi:type IV pilus assembly protein PilC